MCHGGDETVLIHHTFYPAMRAHERWTTQED